MWGHDQEVTLRREPLVLSDEVFASESLLVSMPCSWATRCILEMRDLKYSKPWEIHGTLVY